MTEIQLLGALIGVAIGTPIGIFLHRFLAWLWDEIADWAYDVRYKIRDRRK